MGSASSTGTEPSRDAVGQRRSFDEFEDESRDAVRFFQAVNAADVRVIQRRERLRFTLKAGDPLGVRDERFRQNLDRNVATQLSVARPIDLAHAPHPDLGGDFIRTEARAGSEGQVADYTGRTGGRTR